MKEITSPNGFTVLRKQPIGELDAVMYHMRHEKPGWSLSGSPATKKTKPSE